MASDPLAEYGALTAKVDAFVAGAASAAGDQLTCHRGCSSCCQVELSVTPVEAASLARFLRALPPAAQDAVRNDAGREDGGCVMLDSTGSCRAYGARPLVCRTQGLALRYPPNVVPVETVRLRRSDGEVTWCPLNFEDRPPTGPAVLDAERVDQLLFLVNRRFCEATGSSATGRTPLRVIAGRRAGNPGQVR